MAKKIMAKKNIRDEEEPLTEEEKSETVLRNLARELKQRMAEEDSDLEGYKGKLKKEKDLDREVEEASEKITGKEAEKEAEEIRKKEKDIETEKTLIPLEDYIRCAVHLGTKVITPHMKKYVYKRRADGLAVINTVAINEKLREAIDFLIKCEQKEIYLVCKREAGWSAAKKFEEVTGIKAFTKKYPPGITTNLKLENFFEAELTIICDPWIDRNALFDTARLKKPIIALCDTNNFTTYITKIIPCNNKAKKSIGCILYILAREYCRAKDLPFTAELEDFTGGLE